MPYRLILLECFRLRHRQFEWTEKVFAALNLRNCQQLLKLQGFMPRMGT